MENSKFKFVIIGSGNISNTYLAAMKNIPDTEVTGIVSRSLKKPSTLSGSSDIEISGSLREIKSNFDAVIICTPNGLHHEGAIEAASFGKNVLVEKPLDISIASMDNMIGACRKANAKLGVAYQRRVSGDNKLIKRYIDENRFGRILTVNLTVKNYRDPSYYSNSPYRGTYSIDGGGPFIQQAVHYIDLYAWFFGKPEKIRSSLYRLFHKIEAEDYGVAVCDHNNGVTGTITASTAIKPGFPAIFEIHTEKGTIVMENDVITGWTIEGIKNPSDYKGADRHSGSSSHIVNDTTPHEIIIKDFIDSVRNDREPFINGESARIATEVVLEIYRNNLNRNFEVKN